MMSVENEREVGEGKDEQGRDGMRKLPLSTVKVAEGKRENEEGRETWRGRKYGPGEARLRSVRSECISAILPLLVVIESNKGEMGKSTELTRSG